MLSMYEHPQGVVFKIFVQPRSPKNMIVGLHADALKIKLTAPPVENAANKMCIRFLAKSLGVSNSRIGIITGHTSRTKQVLLRFDKEKTTEQDRNHLKNLINDLL